VADIVGDAQAADEVRQNATSLGVEIPDRLRTDLREQGLLDPVLPVPAAGGNREEAVAWIRKCWSLQTG